MIGSFLSSLLLTSCFHGDENQNQSQILILKSQAIPEVSSDNKQQLYEQIKSQYQQVSAYLEKGVLLDQLKEESKTSPNVINSDFFTNFSNEYNKLLSDIKTFEEQLSNEQKSEINNLISQLEGSSSSPDINLKSIADVFADGQLNKPEICQQIQIALKIITDPNDDNCGKFDEQTYKELTIFLQKQNQLTKTNIDELAKLVETVNNDIVANDSNNANNSNNSTEITKVNNKSPFILSLMAILLSLISLGIIVINYLNLQKFINYQKKHRNNIKTNSQQIKDLESRIQNYHQQIQTFNRHLSDLKDLVNTQSLRLRQLESPNRADNLNPNRDLGVASHNFHSPSHNPLQSTQGLPPENIRLAQSYQENPASLLTNAIQVGMTKETTNKILGGVWEQIYLEENRRRGEYFVVTSNSGEMYLFLNPNSMFNPQTLSTIHKSQLFICNGNLSQSRKGINITIQKPATVKKQAQYWVLVEPGEIILE